jgi:hypothetical protein
MAESLCFKCGKYKLCTQRMQVHQPVEKCAQYSSGNDKKKKKG